MVDRAVKLSRLLASLAAVALVTAAIYALRPFAPDVSLGSLYLFAVLPVAIAWGLAYAIGVSVLSMLAFNFFFLDPVHTLRLSESENWVALGVFLATAVVVSELAARSRRHAASAVAAAAERERLASELVEAETVRRSDALKTAILRAVSHDLRSPLTAIRAAVEGLESSFVELEAADRDALVTTIRLETHRLERLVVNLLDLSRLEVGAATPRPELWTVDGLVGRALEELGAASARVVVALDPDLPATSVDGTQIEHVLVNLLENALKFSSPADPVELTARRRGDVLVVAVDDRGPGIRPTDRERVFEPFERAEHTARGTGLGLAIARGFATANGGSVTAEPGSSGGARFVLTLPASELPAPVAS